MRNEQVEFFLLWTPFSTVNESKTERKSSTIICGHLTVDRESQSCKWNSENQKEEKPNLWFFVDLVYWVFLLHTTPSCSTRSWLNAIRNCIHCMSMYCLYCLYCTLNTHWLFGDACLGYNCKYEWQIIPVYIFICKYIVIWLEKNETVVLLFLL